MSEKLDAEVKLCGRNLGNASASDTKLETSSLSVAENIQISQENKTEVLQSYIKYILYAVNIVFINLLFDSPLKYSVQYEMMG